MKSVLLSIRPKYCELILNKKKIIEIRKNKPKIAIPFKVYIYCTEEGKSFVGSGIRHKQCLFYNPDENKYKFGYAVFELMCCKNDYNNNNFLSGKVVGEFICNRIDTIEVSSYAYNAYSEKSCLTTDDFINYCNGQDLYGWYISNLIIYDEPKELNDFAKANFPTFDEINDDGSLCKYCSATNFGQDFVNGVPDDFKCDIDCYDAYEEYAAQNRFLTRPPQSWCYVEAV